MADRRVLVLEDDHDIAHLVELHLRDLECAADVCAEGAQGLGMALRNRYDLVILDLMLPGMDGLEICRRLRTQSNYVPILMLTAKSTELDRVVGLEIGADDYLTKPFSIRELQARVKALFRRVDAMNQQADHGDKGVLRLDKLEIDSKKRSVTLDGRPVALTAKEFDLLLQFARHPGRVYTRTQLLDLVWGYSYDGYEHTVNSHINRLRAKMEDNPAKPRYILTVWGVGYKFTDTREA
jgi:DNA-binding response OmpR family regulator